MTAIDPTGVAASQDAGWVVARAGGAGFRTEITAGGHGLTADEPASVGGGNAGPSPYDLLLAAIGACTAMTVRMYANRKGWPLDAVRVKMRHGRVAGAAPSASYRLEKSIELDGALTDEQRARLHDALEAL